MPEAEMPRFRLTPHGQAEMVRHLPLALSIAGPWLRGYPHLREELRTAMLVGLAKGVAWFAPEKGFAPGTIIGYSVRSELMDARTTANRLKRSPRGMCVPLSAVEPIAPAPSAPDFDAARLVATLPRRHAAIVRAVVLDGRSSVAVGIEFGVGRERIRQIKRKALARLRERPEVAELAATD